MNKRVAPVWEILKVNSGLFENAIDGVSRPEAESRPNRRTNHIAFLACHLLDARYFLLRIAGGEAENPFADQLGEADGIDDVAEFPTLAEVREAWIELDRKLERRLSALTDADLDAIPSATFPVADETLSGALAFLAQHDSYHIGQLCYLRKYMGHEAVEYGSSS